MDEHDWTSTYPTTTQHLPSMDTPLNFYFRCDTHNVCLDTLASLSHHTFSCSSQQRVRCRWTCGHCALTFATSLALRRHLTLYSVRMGYAKSADFATPQMVNLPYFRRKSHLFPPTALQTMANDILRVHIVPRYNALHNHSSLNILRFSSEAAHIRKSGHLLPQIAFSPISPAQTEDTNSSELPSSDIILTPTLPDEPSCHMGIDNASPLPSVDTTSTIHTSIQTCDSLCRNYPIYRTCVKDLAILLMSSVLYCKNWHQHHCQQQSNKCSKVCYPRTFCQCLLQTYLLVPPLR